MSRKSDSEFNILFELCVSSNILLGKNEKEITDKIWYQIFFYKFDYTLIVFKIS